MDKLKITTRNLVIICTAIIFLFSFFLFGLTGLRTIGTIFGMFLPAYLIMSNFDIEEEEKVFFSFFIGLTIFPLLVWYMNIFIASLTVSIIITFILLSAVGLFLKYKNKLKI